MFDKYSAQKLTKSYLEKYDQLKYIISENNIESPDLKSLLNIYIEPTNLCNLNCIFCARGSMNREVKHLTFNTFQRILE